MCFRPTEISMNVCKKCGASNKPIAKVCASCGAPLEKMKVDMDADQAKLDSFNQMPGMPPSAPAPGSSAPQAPSRPAPPSQE